MNIRIILVDDHKIMRESLRVLIEKQPDMKVIGEAEDGRKAVEVVKKLSPDLVIMDIVMPGLNGIESTRQVISSNAFVKVIVLSAHSDWRFIHQVFKAGASGYLLKTCAFEELVMSIKVVVAHKIYVSSAITDVIMQDYLAKRVKTDSSVFSLLTNREREVLQLIAEGKTTKEIALLLGVSVKTIETHRQQIMMNKLGINSIAELTKYAIREGLTSL